MAVEAFTTTELAPDRRGSPQNDHSKVRFQYFHLPATTVAGDANSTVDLCDLPIGQIRVIPELSRVQCSAFGADRTLSVGHRMYQKRDAYMAQGAVDEPEDADAFGAGIDVSAAATVKVGPSVGFDIFSKEGVRVFATVAGGTIPLGATLSGYIAYTYE